MKKAFTMIELVFVIVVIGILSAVIIPRMERNTLSEAAIQLSSHIRYVQHLAMVDDKYMPNPNMSTAADPAADTEFWYRKRWQMECNNNGCTIYSDTNRDGTAQEAEIATDPQNSNSRLTADEALVANGTHTRAMNYQEKYDVAYASTCGNFISFDHLGRPYAGDPFTFTASTFSNPGDVSIGLLTVNCVITLTDSNGDTATLTIRPETGYINTTYN